MTRLFLDIDGVINANEPQGWGRLQHGHAESFGTNWRIRWAPNMVKSLFELGMELTWATTWRQDAPRSIAPLIGHGHNASWLEKPPFPDYGYSGSGSIGWKFDAMQQEDLSTGFVWIDDEITHVHEYFAKERGGLAIAPNHRTGISPADIDRIKKYLLQKEVEDD